MMAQHRRQTRLVWDSCTALTARSQSGKPYLQINDTAEVLSRRRRAWWLVHTQHRQHSFWTIKNLIQDFISLFGPSKSMPSDMSQGQQLQSVVTEEPQRKPAIDPYSCITRNPNNLPLLSCPACIWPHTASSPKLFLTMMEMLWCGHVPTTGTCKLGEIKANLATDFGKRKTRYSAFSMSTMSSTGGCHFSVVNLGLLYKIFFDSLSLFCTCRASNWSKYKLAKSSKLHVTPSTCSTSVAIGRSIPSNLMAKSSTTNLGGQSLDPGQPIWQTHRVAQGILDLDASGQGRAMWFNTTSTMTSTPEIRI